MMPVKCSIIDGSRQCSNPPEFVVSIVVDSGEYMVGLACSIHRESVSCKVSKLQEDGDLQRGRIAFSPVKSVGTDCIRGDPDDLVHMGTQRHSRNLPTLENKKEDG